MKKTACLLLALLFCFTFAAVPASAAATEGYVMDFDISARAVYLYNMDTDSMISGINAHEPMYPASLTKIMTCILALESTADLDREILTYPTYIQDYLYSYQQQNGAISLAGDLRTGDQLTMRQALYALMLPSANEVAMIIADHIAGSQQDFADMMNVRAKELGARNTNFVNPNGLYDPEHVTTAYDIAQIAMYALTMPEFVTITSTSVYESGPTNRHDNIVWRNTNEMMNQDSSYYYPSIKGVKTGSLPQSGRCFVSTATKEGFSYLLVVMGSSYYDEEGNQLQANYAFRDTATIYDWVFSTFKVRTLVDKGKYVAEIPLRLSMEQDHIKLMTADRFTALLPDTVEAGSIVLDPIVPESLDAPVKKGDVIGQVSLILSGEEMGRVDLLAAESVEASPFLILLEKVLAVTRSFWFKFSLIFLVLLVVFYTLLIILRNRNRRRGGYKPKRRI